MKIQTDVLLLLEIPMCPSWVCTAVCFIPLDHGNRTDGGETNSSEGEDQHRHSWAVPLPLQLRHRISHVA